MSFYITYQKYKNFEFDKFFEGLSPGDFRNALWAKETDVLEFLTLLSPLADNYLEVMAQRAKKLTLQYFGRAILLYTPMYLANYCSNECIYCGFNITSNIKRKKLSPEEVEKEARFIAESGLKHILILTGESRALIASEIETRRQELNELSLRIHANPEVAFREVKSAAWLAEYLKDNGFSIEKGICGLATAFRASYGEGKPAIVLLAEYDALPKIGHACGHNLIATSAVGAGVAAKLAIDKYGGTILVMGTPGEEMYGGKVIMADKGAFNDVDIAMMVHPAGLNTAATRFLACQALEVEFFGKAAHAAARPEVGVNALEAMLQSFAAINSLRQHIKDSARIHGIITDGGEAANIVPAHSAGQFIVRAEDDNYLDELKEKVLDCFRGSATASGARLEYKWGEVRYTPFRNNLTLARLFRRNLQSLGRRVSLYEPGIGIGSSDIGNVSQLVPSIHPLIAIAPAKVVTHSPQFAEMAGSEAGTKALLDAAKALAMTVVDLVANPEVVAGVKEEFKRGKIRTVTGSLS